MGPQTSKNIADIVNETTASVIMQSMQSCMSQSSQTQAISGSFAFGVSQTANNVMNVACASHFNMTNDLALAIASSIQQKAETQGIALLDTLKMSRAENITNIANRITAKISSNLVQQTIANTAQNQVFADSTVIFASQTLDSRTTLKALTDMTANTGIGIDIQNQTNQKGKNTSNNPLSFITDSIYAMLAVLFFIIVVIVGLIYMVLS